MADLKHPVMRPNIRDRLLATLHRSGEILGVILADLAAIDRFDGTLGQWLVLEFLDRLAGDLATIDKETALGPFEQNPIVAFARDDHQDIVRHRRVDLKVRRGVVTVRDRRMPILVLHRQFEVYRRDLARSRLVRTDGPTSDIDVVCPPVGQLATGILMPIAERIMSVAVQGNPATVALSKLRQCAISDRRSWA